MEEIKVGEFIRTKEPYGEIFKVVGIEKEDILLVNTSGNNRVTTGYVKKHSPNIIDLIEVGDYVNGHLIIAIDRERLEISIENSDYGCGYEEINANTDIKTVVTKEQFEAIKYTVGE